LAIKYLRDLIMRHSGSPTSDLLNENVGGWSQPHRINNDIIIQFKHSPLSFGQNTIQFIYLFCAILTPKMKGPKFIIYRDAESTFGVETFHIPDISIFDKTSTKSDINI